jgi:putative ABC transport system ATP-binding protein
MNEEAFALDGIRHALAPSVHFVLDQLHVDRGESIALTGPSGCGKSTLLALIAGLLRSQQGSVRVLGSELGSMSNAELDRVRGRNCGMVFQTFHLLSAFTALENIRIGQRFSSRRGDPAEMLRRVGLENRRNHSVRQLSVGEKQRVAIARALIGRPPILLADEPTGALDPKTGRQVFELMTELVAEHRTTLVMVTHDLTLARELPRQFDCTHLIQSKEDGT